MSETTAPAGKRRPTPDDLEAIIYRVAEGLSLRATCAELGLDPPSTHTWLEEDDGRRQQYARAREMRAEVFQELAVELGLAAATGVTVEHQGEARNIDPTGSRVALDAIKWAAARMAPKTAPVQRIDLTSRTRQMTDAEIEAELAALESGQSED